MVWCLTCTILKWAEMLCCVLCVVKNGVGSFTFILLKLRRLYRGAQGSIFHPTYHTVFHSPHHSLSSSFPWLASSQAGLIQGFKFLFNFSNIRKSREISRTNTICFCYIFSFTNYQHSAILLLPNAGCPQNIIKMTF